MESLLDNGKDGKNVKDGEIKTPAFPDEVELELGAIYRKALNRTLRRLYGELPGDLAPVMVGRVLRAAREAYYTTTNTGHFGLGSRCYCHFTSPIRRYPDLLVHRQLKAALDEVEPPHTIEDLAEMTDHCSERSRQAASFEYQVIDICLALKGHLEGATGETLSGRVDGIIPARVFLKLENGNEAALSTRSLGVDLEVDPTGALLLGPGRDGTDLTRELTEGDGMELDGRVLEPLLRLGQKLLLRVVGIDLLEGRLEVVLVK